MSSADCLQDMREDKAHSPWNGEVGVQCLLPAKEKQVTCSQILMFSGSSGANMLRLEEQQQQTISTRATNCLKKLNFPALQECLQGNRSEYIENKSSSWLTQCFPPVFNTELNNKQTNITFKRNVPLPHHSAMVPSMSGASHAVEAALVVEYSIQGLL